MKAPEKSHKRSGFARLAKAAEHDWAGITHALKHDPAIRQVSLAVVVLTIASAFLPVSPAERLLVAFSTLLVLLMEVVNSAIEAIVDRISTEQHPLSAHAKDLGSVAVGLAVLMSALCWAVIAGPGLLAWLRNVGR